MKILSVDDSKSVHAFIKTCFAEGGHELTQVFDGKQGLDLLMSQTEHPFDLILLDWEMPVMTGPELVQVLSEKGFQTPIIMLTSKNEVEEINRMLEMGVREYVMKPFTKDILLGKIAGLF
jgi:DNA-binding response OmpR family regulator